MSAHAHHRRFRSNNAMNFGMTCGKTTSQKFNK